MHSRNRILTVPLLALLVISLSGLVTTPALGQPPQRVDVFVAFADLPGPAEEALVHAAGGAIQYTYHLVPAIAASLPEVAIAGLSRNPRVARIEPILQVHALDAELDSTWGVKRIGAGTVHDSGNVGAGVKVAVIDSGIDYTHLDLDDNYAGGWDFANDDSDPMDDDGHGTHVAGTIAAEDNNTGVVGVAPGASLYGLKVLGAGGSGSYADVIAALQWAVDNGIQVTNSSYGSSGDPGVTVRQAFDNASANGVVNVCSAGNSGNPAGKGDNVGYPARYGSCIAVAATDSSDARARFSSTGPDVELAAPGVAINSTRLGGGYVQYSGTSMASPHVAGVAALVIASGVGDSGQVRLVLQGTADDLGSPGRDTQYGYGLVDAVEAAGSSVSQSPPPSGGSTTMYVAAIDMSGKSAGPNRSATAVVTIRDTDGSPVEGATVYGVWGGDYSGSVSGLTSADGRVSFNSGKVRQANATFTFAVTDVTKSGYTYDPNLNDKSSDTVTVP